MPEASVRKLREEPVEKVIAAGVNIVVTLPEGRQISFSTGFEGDESDQVVNARFDRIFRLADRQRARYEIDELEAEIAEHDASVAALEKNRAEIDKRHEINQASNQVQIETWERDSVAAWSAAKKQGPHKFAGAMKVNVERMQAAMTKADEEHKVERANWAVTMERNAEQRAKRVKKLEAAKALAEG